MPFQLVTLDVPGGEVKRDNEVYVVVDNTFLQNLTVSQTTLHPGQSTQGHSHDGLDEVYIFISGQGRMELDDALLEVKAGDMVLIPGGTFHRVHQGMDIPSKDLIFTCIFQQYEREEDK